MIDECFEKAKDLLKRNATKRGVIAGREYYKDVWGRDGLITSLGMSCSEDESLVSLSEVTINNISRFQKPNGQLPNKFSPTGTKLCFGEGGCVDTTLWYPIAVLNHYKHTSDKPFLRKHAQGVEKALFWASCLDQNNDLLLETNEGSDWMDLLLRSGRVLYDQVVYYKALLSCAEIHRILGRKGSLHLENPQALKKNINVFFWPEQRNLNSVRFTYGHTGIEKDFETILREGEKDYYYAEVGFRRYDPRFDTFANLLAIVLGIADPHKTTRILDYIQKEGVDRPHPVKVLHPPIGWNDAHRILHFRWTEIPHLQAPGNYHNGGIWPLAGGFHIMALKKSGREWKHPLQSLAEACKKGKPGNAWEFNEWLTADGHPLGSAYQAWSAGMYILAYQFAKGNARI
jgi:hypothetical protein